LNARHQPVAAALLIPLLLTGCSLLPTTRKLPVPKAPSITQTVTPEELVGQVDERWEALNSLTATVEIQASVAKSKEGVATDYPSVHGHILMRKPGMLRVFGQLFGVRVFDTASDGKNFTLHIPSKNKAIQGANSVKVKSTNTMENMRPGFFFDAMVVRGLEPDDLYSVVADSETVEDAARKHLYTVPEYVLSISRRKTGSNELTPERIVTFNRDNLLPSQQDIYDNQGNLETQVFYAAYQNFEGNQYPSKITIKRPLEEFQIVLTVDDVHENQALTDETFLITLPEGTDIQHLE
jgi:outer membrane lipoprotein-sorting protein